jgi:hypothetical protein
VAKSQYPLKNACATRPLPLLLLLFMLPAMVQAQFNYPTNNDGTMCITGYTDFGGAVVIPDTIDGLPVACIGDYAFRLQIRNE